MNDTKCFVLGIEDAYKGLVKPNFSLCLERLSQVVPVQNYRLYVVTFDSDDPVLLGSDSVSQSAQILAQTGGVLFSFDQVYSASQKTDVGECLIVFLPKDGRITDDNAFVVACADSCLWNVRAVNRNLLTRIVPCFQDTQIVESTLDPYFLLHFGDRQQNLS